MRDLVEYNNQNGFGKRPQTIDQQGINFRSVYGQSAAEAMRPISININVNRDNASSDKPKSSFFRSKFIWLLLTLAISSGLAYTRTRYLCQGLKDGGRFYYGMDVNRCVGILIKEPFANIEQQLSAINGRY